MNPEISALADTLVALRFKQEPLEAALLGLTEGDVGLADLSASFESETLAAYEIIAKDAADLRERLVRSESTLDEVDLVALDHVQLSASTHADHLRVRGLEYTISDFHIAPLSALIATLYQLPLDSEARRAAHLRRLATFRRFLGQAADRLRDGIAKGRTPTARGVRAASAQIEEVLADRNLSGLRRQLAEANEDFSFTQDQLILNTVVPALQQYRDFLLREALPAGRSDERPGLSWLPDGEELYRTLIRASTSTSRTPRRSPRHRSRHHREIERRVRRNWLPSVGN